MPTIELLRERGARVVLCSHLGRPQRVDPALSLAPVGERLGELLSAEVVMAPAVVGDEVSRAYADVATAREAARAELDPHVAELPPWAWWWGDQLRVEHETALDEEADRLVAMRDSLRETISSLLDTWIHRADARADEAADEAGWRRLMRAELRPLQADASGLLEAILVDRVFCEAERGASSLSDLADRRSGVTLLGPAADELESVATRMVELYRVVGGRPLDDVLELFTPTFGSHEGAPDDLLEHEAVESFAARLGVDSTAARARRIRPPDARWPNAACFDLGSFADPVWFVRTDGTSYDTVAAVHELAHVLTACGIRRTARGARLGITPPLVGEIVAYGLSAVVATEAAREGREGALTEFLRIAAVSALGALFVGELYPIVEEAAGDGAGGGHVLGAWQRACAAVGTTAEGAGGAAFLLIPRIAWEQDLCRLHLLAQVAAVGIAALGSAAAVAELVELARAWSDRAACERALGRVRARMVADTLAVPEAEHAVR